MTASLIVAGFEMLDPATDPQYRLASGLNFGSGEPDQAVISSVYLDGDAVTGRRTKNRAMQLPVFADGTDALLRAGYVNDLLQAVSAQTFTVQWTPDGGLPVVFDCYRASWSQPDMDMTEQHLGRAARLLTFSAKPFGRSPDVATVAAAASQTQLDSFATAPSGATLDTAVKFEGTGSAKVTLATFTPVQPIGTGYRTSAPVARTYGSAQNLTGARAITLRVLWPAPADSSDMTFSLTLTSAAGNALVSTTKTFSKGDTVWRLVVIPLTGNLGTLDLTAVTGYSLVMTSAFLSGGVVTSAKTLHLDDERWLPSSSALTTTTHSANLLLPSTVGSARAPANLALTNGATFTSFLLHTPPDDQDVDAQILTGLNVSVTNQTATVAQANAGFAGTYSVVLGVGTLGSGAVTATVTITQRENGTAVGSAKVLTLAYTSGAHLLDVGEVTLPLYAVPVDNSLTDYTVQVQITGTDRYTELMLLDTRGQTVYTDTDLGTAVAAAYIDEPSILQSGAPVYGSATDRTGAYSVLDSTVCTGGPPQLDPGVNKMLIWTDSGTPAVAGTYDPRWIDERVA